MLAEHTSAYLQQFETVLVGYVAMGSVVAPRTLERKSHCVVCGHHLVGAFRVNVLGEAVCVRHPVTPVCPLCALPVPTVAGGRMPSGPRYCRRCSSSAVLRQEDVARLLPPIKHQLRRLGIRLRQPVRVRLTDPSELVAATGGTGSSVVRTCGLTRSTGHQVLDLMVASGLPSVEFGATVAHEATHAWFVQNAYPPMSPQVCEGMCQLTAYAWARRQPDPLAVAVLRSLEESQDPVYGDGFRMSYEAARRVGVPRVLQYLAKTGRLP